MRKLLVPAVLAGLVACGGCGGDGGDEEAGPVEEVAVSTTTTSPEHADFCQEWTEMRADLDRARATEAQDIAAREALLDTAREGAELDDPSLAEGAGRIVDVLTAADRLSGVPVLESRAYAEAMDAVAFACYPAHG